MRFQTFAIIVGASAALLGGCARDTLQHGPFLIGAARPDIRDGVCCPSQEIRSQDARSNWTPCTKAVLGCGINTAVSRDDVIIEERIDLKRIDRSTDVRRRPRSAWDG